MLGNRIKDVIVSNIGFKPTAGQDEAIELLSQFVINPNSNQCFLLKGYAGTGKTSLIASFVKALSAFKVPYVLLAPTGRAAKVLSSYCGFPAYTIHKWIYRQKGMKDGEGRFDLNINMLRNAIFIVDEASMLSNSSYDDSIFGSGKLLNDLIAFVNRGVACRLIIVGDVAQLPPVGLSISPALDAAVLETFDLNVIQAELVEVVRQEEGSGILHNATIFREMLDSDIIEIPTFELNGFKDIQRLPGAELIETLTSEYDKFGREGNVVLSYSNKRANKYNEGIRSRILWKDEELSVGDFLMVVRNSYFWVEDKPEIGFIANGDIVEVTRIRKHSDLYGFRFADVTIKLIDYQNQEIDVKILLDTLTLEGPSLTSAQNKELYTKIAEDYHDVKTRPARLKKIKEDPYFNAMQVKFAYAVTCHKAQGGQWRNVFIDQGFFKEDMISREYLRWLYTALTRATEKVYLVNFDDKFF
ncbi:MAG: ATP-dependent endonuclease [Bacteroidales bacterium]|nr:MAG: ATP-dependent endonuclease [Bacteroidales bacterium]